MNFCRCVLVVADRASSTSHIRLKPIHGLSEIRIGSTQSFPSPIDIPACEIAGLDKTRVRKFCVHARAIGSRPAYIGERGVASLSLGGGHANRVVGASSHAYCLICLTNGATDGHVCAVTASSVSMLSRGLECHSLPRSSLPFLPPPPSAQ